MFGFSFDSVFFWLFLVGFFGFLFLSLKRKKKKKKALHVKKKKNKRFAPKLPKEKEK